MGVLRADETHLTAVSRLALLLWPDHGPEDLEREFSALLASPDAAILLALEDDGAVAFAQFSLRRDYVEGARTSPVGYLEGIFVLPEHRGKGIARRLLAAGEVWAREKGCREMASDCELGNDASVRFHIGAGFAEANRVVCFVKPIAPR